MVSSRFPEIEPPGRAKHKPVWMQTNRCGAFLWTSYTGDCPDPLTIVGFRLEFIAVSADRPG